jgi:folate-dependent phosphoribosylglycinamide formyltransferase PurN
MKKKVLIFSTYDTFFLNDLLIKLIKQCDKNIEFKFFLVSDHYSSFKNILIKFLSFGFLKSTILIIVSCYRKFKKQCIADIFYDHVITGKNLKEIEDEIKKNDLILSINYPYLIPQKYLQLTKYGGINHHLGKLPTYAGRYPVAKAIINKEDKIYITIHNITKNFDSGEILSETIVDISDLKNNFFEIYKRVFKRSFEPISNSLMKKNVFSTVNDENKAKIKNLKLSDLFKLYFLR